jgi:Na+-driven multidrug efflux pump
LNFLQDLLVLLLMRLYIYIFIYIFLASGVARGSGWQHIGAYVNLGAFYLVGLPVGAVLGFMLHLRGKGLWIGIVIGTFVQSTLLSLITGFTNWKKQVCSPSVYFLNNSAILFTGNACYICVWLPRNNWMI